MSTSLAKLPIRVRNAFRAAQENGDLNYYQTQVSILQFNGLPFQVRFSPALANKPTSERPHEPKGRPIDPFANPPRGLFIADLPSHNLILNKFPVIPNHFILATKDFKDQTDLLEEDDLGAAYECLKLYRDNEEELFGFFNSGEHSGASQPHRHIQFLPVESMRSGIGIGERWNVLADSLTETQRPDLPFAYLSSPIPQDPSAKALLEIYLRLYNEAVRIVQASTAKAPSQNPQSSISYNLGMTDRVLVLCPRASEGKNLQNSDGEDLGVVALNGTVLGGTMLVKSEAEYFALKNDQSKLIDILCAIGFPPTRLDREEQRL